jgi:hypothetical protein
VDRAFKKEMELSPFPRNHWWSYDGAVVCDNLVNKILTISAYNDISNTMEGA